MIQTFITFTLLILVSNLALADSKPIQLEGKKFGKFPIRVLGSAKYQNGNFGSADKTTVKPRHLNGFGADANAGLVLGSFIIGGGGEYMSWFQASKVSDDSEFTGSTVNFFGSVGVTFHHFLLLGKYIFNSTYQVNKKDTNGDKIKYSGPEGSYAINLIYRTGSKTFLNLEYTDLTYGKKSAATSNTLKGGERIKFSTIGLSYGVIF